MNADISGPTLQNSCIISNNLKNIVKVGKRNKVYEKK